MKYTKRETKVAIIKTTLLAFVILTAFTFIVSNTDAFASNSSSTNNSKNNVTLLNIHTVPSTVHVGDTFKINATVINNSTNTIKILGTNEFCNNPLTSKFDKNVITNPGPSGPACKPIPPSGYTLKPGELITLSTLPTRGISSFSANTSGITSVEIQLKYEIVDQNYVVSTCTIKDKTPLSSCIFKFDILSAIK